MEKILIAIATGLFFFCLFLLVRLVQLRRHVRKFIGEMRQDARERNGAQICVDCFDKDVVALANALNEHIRMRRELTREKAEERQELDRIISGISHDFRTPLTASLGYLQMLQKSEKLGEEERQYLQTVLEKNKYIKELSDDFFALTCLGKEEEQKKEEIDLSRLLSQMVLEQYEWVKPSGIAAEISIEEGICTETVPHNMERILNNLFSNARKYAISTFRVGLHREQGKILLTVGNDFQAPEDIDCRRVFEPFYRAKSRNRGGSGLGLYVVKCLCDKLGYEITAQKEDEYFWISLRIQH